jgi:uncharacterized protein (DUF2141 family)
MLNMKLTLSLILFFLLVAGCNSAPEIVDNGKPGQIKVIIYLDDNRNSAMDAGEPGLTDKVGISQDVSCPASSMDNVTVVETASSGETVFSNLKPGRYCVAYMGDKGLTTKLTKEVNLSSDQVLMVAFGLTE